ncbi:MAG: hypothetical protein IPH57_07135 [Saprospiraceae bacterium]|nr:hypothetical protein [Saprospiraceae bacterium]
MDLRTIIIAIVLIGVCILPFALIYINGQKKKNALLDILKNIAFKNNATITKHDLWKDSGIGMDEGKKHLFFFSKHNEDITELEQKLEGIKKCRIEKNGRTVKSSGSSYSVLDKLDLVFENETGKVSSFPFFNSAVNMQLTNELEIAQNWEKFINERLVK